VEIKKEEGSKTTKKSKSIPALTGDGAEPSINNSVDYSG
jgi:hypothetical protein